MLIGKWIRTKKFREKMSNLRKGICLNTGRTHFKKGQIPYIMTKQIRKKLSIARIKYLKLHPMLKSYNWKGGKIKEQGYILIYMPSHPFANKKGYIKQARLVMEKKIGRYLRPEEVIHHKGIKYPLGSIKNKQDDRLKNLELFINHYKHMLYHRKIPNYSKHMSNIHKK